VLAGRQVGNGAKFASCSSITPCHARISDNVASRTPVPGDNFAQQRSGDGPGGFPDVQDDRLPADHALHVGTVGQNRFVPLPQPREGGLTADVASTGTGQFGCGPVQLGAAIRPGSNRQRSWRLPAGFRERTAFACKKGRTGGCCGSSKLIKAIHDIRESKMSRASVSARLPRRAKRVRDETACATQATTACGMRLCPPRRQAWCVTADVRSP
jgi:ribosomal protein L34E